MVYQYRNLEDGTKQVCGSNGVWRKARATKAESAAKHANAVRIEAMLRATEAL